MYRGDPGLLRSIVSELLQFCHASGDVIFPCCPVVIYVVSCVEIRFILADSFS